MTPMDCNRTDYFEHERNGFKRLVSRIEMVEDLESTSLNYLRLTSSAPIIPRENLTSMVFKSAKKDQAPLCAREVVSCPLMFFLALAASISTF